MLLIRKETYPMLVGSQTKELNVEIVDKVIRYLQWNTQSNVNEYCAEDKLATQNRDDISM